MEASRGLAGLVVVKTTCLSDRTMGIELTDKLKERLLLVGDVGVWGSESSLREFGMKLEIYLKIKVKFTRMNIAAMTARRCTRWNPKGRVFGVI